MHPINLDSVALQCDDGVRLQQDFFPDSKDAKGISENETRFHFRTVLNHRQRKVEHFQESIACLNFDQSTQSTVEPNQKGLNRQVSVFNRIDVRSSLDMRRK